MTGARASCRPHRSKDQNEMEVLANTISVEMDWNLYGFVGRGLSGLLIPFCYRY